MGLRDLPLRATAARPRVLVVALPGATRVRLAAEQELRRRDLPTAPTPAQADLLLVAGPDCPALADAVDRLWQDMPAPRARAQVRTADEVAAVIGSARAALATPPPRTGAEDRHARSTDRHPRGGHRHGGGGGESHGGTEHPTGTEHRTGHEGHRGHGGGMEMPAGLPTAERGPDRDGLALDRLHVSFGPFLPDWPAGLTIRLTLQGDVIQHAALVEPAPSGAATALPYWSEPWMRAAAGQDIHAGDAARRRAAAHLDSLGRFLAVAGWPTEATAARRLRDDLLAEAPEATGATEVPEAPQLRGARSADLRRRAERFARRVGRSRTLHWLTRGMGNLTRAEAEAAGVSGPAARADGDVPARYRQWLTAVLDDIARLEHPGLLDPAGAEGPRGRPDGPRSASTALAAALPRLLEGTEVAAARLIVASLDPDPDELAALLPEAARG
ncbi:hypothetical protein ACFO3J_25545 [Streptomyces polygonati]|uniref:Uncharacterized protein n=1 Tax=Streptomyces polygonati TaxID=1617087 RepID=A0ABV8HS70_9ACTN